MSAAWPRALAEGWHPVAYSDEVGAQPRACLLMGLPLVLVRLQGHAVAMLDRCPHRHVPLSVGKVRGDTLQCAYHGWRFGPDGRCSGVPGSDACPPAQAQVFPAREAAGLVWVSTAAEPASFPCLPEVLEDPAQDRFWWRLDASQARVLDAVENLLDPAHPHSLHPWLVRPLKNRRPVRVRFHAHATGGEAMYDETEVQPAWMPRLFEGRRTTVVARYAAPATAQLAFHAARGPTLTLTVVFSPETVDRTRPYAHFATPRGLLPPWLKRWLLKAFHLPVLRQDQAMLARQVQASGTGPAAAYCHGPLDLFGPLIWHLAHGRPVKPATQDHQFML